jgi:hypothetical protein
VSYKAWREGDQVWLKGWISQADEGHSLAYACHSLSSKPPHASEAFGTLEGHRMPWVKVCKPRD